MNYQGDANGSDSFAQDWSMISLQLGNNYFSSVGQQLFLVSWATIISLQLGNNHFSSVGQQRVTLDETKNIYLYDMYVLR